MKMYTCNYRQLLIAFVTALFFTGCVTTPDTAQVERAIVPGDQTPKTLAIFPFENNSVTDPVQYAPLSKGLCAMLITDLDKNGSALKLIERNKIQDLVKEIAFGQGGSVDESTAVQVGKILGAQSIAFGSFMVLGDNVRMDVRIINVETSALIIAESITGKSSDFMVLETQLAKKIADSLRVVFVPADTSWEKNMDAALFFSKGLDAWDRGNRTEAEKYFAKSIAIDPSFRLQVEYVEGL